MRRGGRRGGAGARRRARPRRRRRRRRGRPARRETTATSTGRTSFSRRGSATCTPAPSAAPDQAADEAHRDRLDEVRGEHGAARGPEAAQDGHRGHAALDEDVDGARDAEAAEEEGDEGDEAEEVPEAGERVAEAPLVVGHGADVEALGGEPRPEAVGDLLGVRPRWQAQVGLVAGPRAAGEELRLADPRAGHEDARAEGAPHAHVARHVLDGRPQDEPRLAEGDLVPDLRSEADEQRSVGDGTARLGEARPLAGRRRLDRPVERVAGVDGEDLDEPRRLARPARGPSRRSSRRGPPPRAASSPGAPRRGGPRPSPGTDRPSRGRGRPRGGRGPPSAPTRAGCR